MKKNKAPVVIININRNGIGIARSLDKKSYSCYGAGTKNTHELGHYSNAFKKTFSTPHPSREPEAFILQLLRIGRKIFNKTGQKPFLIPTNDIYVQTFVTHIKRISTVFQCAFETDSSTLDICLLKTKIYQYCEQHDIDCPSTHYTLESYQKSKNLNQPVVIKPDNRNLENGNVFRIKLGHSAKEVKAAINELHHNGCTKYIIQSYIPGEDDQLYTAGISSVNGKLYGLFWGRKVRQFPPKLGECSLGESMPIPADMKTKVSALLMALRYTGMAQIEFKHHEGKYYLMEINPRSWSWNSLATHTGVNLPLLLLQHLGKLDNDFETVQSRPGASWHYATMDLLYNNVKNKNVSLLQIIKSCAQADVHALFSWRDPLPALVELIKLPMTFIYKQFRRHV